ncbi:uncharacterized protein FSUBG_11847 [Fusarium subglutinans]|uniref:DUF5672 domain-containing protein n=1 Tax=Gibberella subglutinans TaxID=42677 RepID=A0A8H5L8N1_GIBSU|nr:uncharacterized protein FSUBG_11847 [Fusarium subglutinans]KAF5587307.1 hypothetical protein FSUBG_11847 [Fusarium subglutinans]
MMPSFVKLKLRRDSLQAPLIAIVALLSAWFIALIILPQCKPAIASARQNLPSIAIDWSPNNDPRKNYNASKVALIIEPEPLPLLVPLILHMIGVVPPDWRFIFVGSKKSVWTVGRAFGIQVQQGLGKIEMMQLPQPWKIRSREDRSRLLTDTRFYDEFLPGVEWLLMFSSDSILCANSELSLNDWLDYTWAGATDNRENKNLAVYGDLSLRRVSAIKQILSFQSRYNDSATDDSWFGPRLEVLPDAKLAMTSDRPFAVQNNITLQPMGYNLRAHGDQVDKEVWKFPEARKEALKYCPEIHIILSMKLEKERCPGDNRMGQIVASTTTAEAASTTS